MPTREEKIAFLERQRKIDFIKQKQATPAQPQAEGSILGAVGEDFASKGRAVKGLFGGAPIAEQIPFGIGKGIREATNLGAAAISAPFSDKSFSDLYREADDESEMKLAGEDPASLSLKGTLSGFAIGGPKPSLAAAPAVTPALSAAPIAEQAVSKAPLMLGAGKAAAPVAPVAETLAAAPAAAKTFPVAAEAVTATEPIMRESAKGLGRDFLSGGAGRTAAEIEGAKYAAAKKAAEAEMQAAEGIAAPDFMTKAKGWLSGTGGKAPAAAKSSIPEVTEHINPEPFAQGSGQFSYPKDPLKFATEHINPAPFEAAGSGQFAYPKDTMKEKIMEYMQRQGMGASEMRQSLGRAAPFLKEQAEEMMPYPYRAALKGYRRFKKGFGD